MQSLASLMSVKPADIGNLDDFNESDEEEEKKSVTATGELSDAASSPLTFTQLFPLTFPFPFSSPILVTFFCFTLLLWLLQSLLTL